MKTIILFFILSSVSFAQTPSPSPTPHATPAGADPCKFGFKSEAYEKYKRDHCNQEK